MFFFTQKASLIELRKLFIKILIFYFNTLATISPILAGESTT